MKASLIVVLALAATAVMRNRSAAVRHWVLAVAVLCAAATPLLERIVPSWHPGLGQSVMTQWSAPSGEQTSAPAPAVVPLGSAPAASARRNPVAPQSDSATTIDLTRFVLPIWMTGAAIDVLLLIAGLCRLTSLARQAQRVNDGPWIDMVRDIAHQYGLTRPVTILVSDRPTLVMTWGWLKPRIIVPQAARTWTDDRIRVVLSHELAHVQRGDWLTQLTAEVLRAVYWFNPLLWIAGTRLRQESEQACDDAVLASGVEGSDYAGHLLDLARDAVRHQSRWSLHLPAPAIVRPSSFERRVTAMLSTHVNRTPPTRSARLLAFAALLAITIPLAGFGQNFSTVTGVVTDPEGRMIPNVEVVLRSTQREARYEVKTNRLGQYDFVGVADGDYVLEAQFMGFRHLRDTVSVAGQPVQRNLSMEVGMIQETITVVGGPASPAAPPVRRTEGPQWRPAAEYDPCGASPVGGCLKPPTKIRDVKPAYPPHLNDSKVGGVVVLSAKIGTEGSIVSAQLADPADRIDPALAQAAIAAVTQWQFTPTRLGGVPIETDMQVTVNFVVR